MDGKQNLESYIVRIWLECGSREDPVWRGHVRHVQGKEEAYFQDLVELTKFIEKVSGVAGPGATGLTLKGPRTPTV